MSTVEERIERHPHMQQCPHCGVKRPKVSVESDAQEITWIEVTSSGKVDVGESQVSLLDNTEVNFLCCSTEVYDRELRDLMIEVVYG